MKTINNLKKYLVLAALVIFIASCEKGEIEDGTTTVSQQEEGFKSTTGNSNSDASSIEINNEEAIFHVNYNGNLTKEEADVKFNNDVKHFIKEYKNLNKGVSTEWFYRIATNTGTQTNNQTDDRVLANVLFLTDKGYKSSGYRVLDNPGNDREQGDWDYYIFRTSISGQAVSWVDAKAASLALKGTDGWFVKRFYAQAYTSIQSISSSGYTATISLPDVWLDNSNNNTYDYFHTGVIGSGRLNF